MGNPNSVREMTAWQGVRWWLYRAFVRARRKLPHLVWYGDELDVCVTFATEALTADSFEAAARQFSSGDLLKAQHILNDLGVAFDTGLGPEGRDWEWDWSLRGPISVRFRQRAKHPERRASKQTLDAASAALAAVQKGAA